MRRKLFIGAGALLLALGLAQLHVPARENPPVTSEAPAPEPVRVALRTACYDCHSNETRWPWYARVAPASWLVARDVVEGRAHLNFSEWDRYPEGKRARLLEEIREEVEEGGMPLGIYVLMHPDARLRPEQVQLLMDWTRGGARTEAP